MSNVFGCSACLVAAIELRDEATVRRMFADSNVQYADTVWLPLPIRSPFHMIESHENRIFAALSSSRFFDKYSFMSCIAANNLQVGVNGCPHPTAIETLEAGYEPKSCVISVVLMAMLFSTPKFNALQILIESGRFDLRDPLIFHQCNDDYFANSWKLIAISTLGMALLIDRATYTGSECRLFLTRSLLDAFLASLDGVFIGFQWINSNKWNSFRARGPIAFLFNCDSIFEYLKTEASSTIVLIETLSRIGFEQSSPIHSYFKRYHRRIYDFNANWLTSDIFSNTVFDILVSFIDSMLFFMAPYDFSENVHLEYWITRFLRMGLLFPELGSCCLPALLNALHNDDVGAQSKFFRICRQLFALGIFQQPDLNSNENRHLSWGRRCIYNSTNSWSLRCEICRIGHLINNTEECPVVAPLVREFLSGPLTLLQLARIKIRRLIGVRHFERRVDTLKQLPPLCLRYVARADEMLAEAPAIP